MTLHRPIPRPLPVAAPVAAHVSMTLRVDRAQGDPLTRHVRLLRDCVALSQQRWSFTIDAAVVLPTELIMLCAFDDTQFGVRGAVKLIQSGFAKHCPSGVFAGWSDDCEVHEISAAAVAIRKTFIEEAPVRAGLVKSASDWPYSSANKHAPYGTYLGAVVA